MRTAIVVAGLALLCARAVFAADGALGETQGDEDGLGLSPISMERVESAEVGAPLEGLEPDLGTFRGINAAAGAPLASIVHSYDPQFNAAGELLKSEGFKRVASDARAPLERTWGSIQAIRTDLLNEAPRLDSRKDAAIAERDALNQESASLAARKSALARQVDDFNRTCVGTLPPNQYYACVARQRALNQAVNAYNADVRGFQAKASSWKSRRDALLAAIKTWADNGEAWFGLLKKLVNDANEAIKKTNTGDCTEKQHRDLQDEVDNKCSEGRSCNITQDCKTLIDNLRKVRACRDARKKIIDVCYGGKPTDPRHEKMLREAEESVKNCEDVLNEKTQNLRRAISFKCNAPLCSADQDCDALRKNLAAHLECVRLCDNMHGCLDQADPELQAKQERARQAIAQCNELIGAKCAPVGTEATPK